MTTELIHADRDNANEFLLLTNGVAMVDASAITRMVLTLTPGDGGADNVIDSDADITSFDWSGTTNYQGETVALLVLILGGLGIAKGEHDGKLEIYAPDYPNGLVWATGIDFKVL